MRFKKYLIFIILLFCLELNANSFPLQLLKLPAGFTISVYAAGLKNPRELALGKNGIVYVGTRSDKVYALVPNATHTKADKINIIASNLNAPNGVTYQEGSLYVAEINQILRYDNIDEHLSNPPKPITVKADLPNKSHHGLRVIHFGPDGLLYISIGMPCNICTQDDPHFGTIMRMKKDGSNFEIYAKGIRNSVGFAWHPVTKELWFTDNGRDWLGDNLPPDELNKATHIGMNFGFPFYYGKNHPDPNFSTRPSASLMTPAEVELDPHVAALGMIFYTGKMFPKTYQNQIFIAEHGSWNRSKKIGYRVTLVTLKNNKPESYTPFIEGWLQGQSYWGRPVDLLVLPDGSLLISDDDAGVIYNVSFRVQSRGKQNENSYYWSHG